MEWHEKFGIDSQPSWEDMEEYTGSGGAEGRELWNELFGYMQRSYKAKPKMSYSGCSGKPGWNVKFQKSGVSFGTLYPEKNGFSVFTVISYKLEPVMELIKERLSPEMRDLYENAQDYMKMGKWMMFRIENRTVLEDYKLLMSVKMRPAE